MQVARPRNDEAAALAALRKLDVLDSGPEAEFDALVRAASLICGTPISVISLVDTERQWFKANIGLPGVSETPRDVAFCAHAVLTPELFEIPDATQDPRFHDNPLVTNAPDIRFYAGAPVTLTSGERIGTICVIDRQPRQLDATQREVLGCLARAAAHALEGRRAIRANVEAARESARAALVLQHSADAIIGLDNGRRVVRWNPAAERLFGYPAGRIVGRTLDRLVPPGRAAEELGLFARVADGQACSYETVRLHHDGQAVHVAVTAVPEFDIQGQLCGVTKFMRDISARVHEAQALALSEERMRRLYESTPAMMHSIDTRGRMLAVSDLWLTKLGYARSEVIGRPAQDFLTPESRQRSLHEVMPKMFTSGRIEGIEYQMLTSDGRILDMLVSAVVERDELGRPLHSLSVLDDVTERRRAERALQEQTERLRLATDSAEIGVWELDPARGTIEWDDWMFRLYGVARADGAQPMELWSRHLHPDDAVRVGAELSAALEGHGTYRPEFRIVWTNGEVRHLQAAAQVTRDDTGRPLRMIGVNLDVTRQRRSEEALREAKQAAESANVAKSAFLANMSHEIRTPMNAILGMLALLRKTDMTARQADYAGKTEGAARALLDLLNDILDFSKVEAGKMTLDPQPFRVEQLLRDLSVIMGANIGPKDVEVLFDIDPALPNGLVGDVTRLRQVLINLGGNAIKFTERGEVVVSIFVVARGHGDVTLQVAVRDSGIGIAPENQQRIFSGFTQAEASTTRRFGGTGLGLAICQRLVALMGSELQLESALGSGSRFHFTLNLPVAVAEIRGSDGFGGAAGAAFESATGGRAPRVLVIEDNPAARAVFQRLAGGLGWQVESAGSGESALRQLTESPEPFDAIFVDGQMPGLDGWQTCRQIRERQLAGRTPLLMMVTAHGREMLSARPADEQQLLSGFLVKPVTRTMLRDAWAEAGGGRRSPAKMHVAPAAARRLAGLRLLVAEDNANNQQVARELLEDEGAVVQIAVNGRAAVDAVAAAEPPFDAVLMDLQMPVMDGYAATGCIRQDARQTALPIIAMTANAMASDREACLAAGMNAHIGKPFDLDALVRLLRHLTGRNDESSASAERAAPAPGAVAPDVLAAAAEAGVDLHEALVRMGGRSDVYARMLRNFCRDLRQMPEQLAAHRADGDYAEACRLMHNLKGLAATLGAKRLAVEAGHAEAHFGDPAAADKVLGEPMIRRVAAAVGVALPGLARLHEALDGALHAGAAPNQADPSDRTALVQALRELAEALDGSDMSATQLMQELRNRHAAALGDRLQPLDEAVASLDFATALGHCKDLIESRIA